MGGRVNRKEESPEVIATFTLRSQSGKSIFERAKGRKASLREYRPSPEAFLDSRRELGHLGFRIVSEGKFSLSAACPRAHFERTLGVQLRSEQAPLFKDRKAPTARYYVADKELRVPKEIAHLIERISLPQPVELLQSPNAPDPDYHHLHVPEDVSFLMKSSMAHAHGWTGQGVRVAMVDTGFYNHPYYANKGYNVTVAAVVGNTANDEYGHGTGIASNLLAVAPEIDFVFVKMTDGVTWAALAAFQEAVSRNPSVITCSWGSWFDATLEAEIQAAVDSGIVVVFACGNGGPIAWPGEMPEVISVGGAMVDETYAGWQASDYASSGVSGRYQNRSVPDVCGIVGPAPSGVFIVMPTEPGSILDQDFAGADGTQVDDGWLVASGTSSAAPMVAGVAALLRQKNSNLSPDTVKTILQITARDITTGLSAAGDAAAAGVDQATGHGLVDAEAALEACFLATASYGSRLAPEVQLLRDVRNQWIHRSDRARLLVDKAEGLYYRYSPRLAARMNADPHVMRAVRWGLVAPIVFGLRALTAARGVFRHPRKPHSRRTRSGE